MDVKDVIAASNLEAMSNVEVVAALVVACRPVVIKTELTMYVKDRNEHGRNCVINVCLIIGVT